MQPYVEVATSLGESSLWLIRMVCCSHNYFYIYTRGFRANFWFPFYLGFVKQWQIDSAWRCNIAVCNLLESLCDLWVIPNAKVPKTLPCLLWKRCFLGLWHLRVEKKKWSFPLGVESIILCLPVQMFYHPKLLGAEAIIKQAISEFPQASVSKVLSLWYGNDISFSCK